VTVRVLASPNAARAAAARARGDVGLALYQVGRPELPGIGHLLPRAAINLPGPPTVRAWDFLSIALGVFGADRFLPRFDTADGWTRIIALDVEVVEPEPWAAEATRLADALRFVSGDIWSVHFWAGGQSPPSFKPSITDRDCTCLFSGGLDSLIGAMDLVAEGRRPLLVSQASPKEGPVQEHLASRIGLSKHRFEGRATERAGPFYEPSSRARSLLFFAYGALAASGLGGELFVPENGFIAINPPLTRRRVGSLSTRTTHPHFIASLQAVLDSVGLGVTLLDHYADKTKGEMLAGCADRNVEQLAAASYSCGKGKRLNRQCGRCVPCLIRRAAFHKAGIEDTTNYVAKDLAQHAKNDDVQAARLASARFTAAALAHGGVARWAAEAGPLPIDPTRRTALVAVVERGLQELRDFLGTVTWP